MLVKYPLSGQEMVGSIPSLVILKDILKWALAALSLDIQHYEKELGLFTSVSVCDYWKYYISMFGAGYCSEVALGKDITSHCHIQTQS